MVKYFLDLSVGDRRILSVGGMIMYSKKIQKLTGLTRKAIEYYEEKGIITPLRLSNDYREYKNNDVETLKKVNLYRKLGLTINQIIDVLNNKITVADIIRDKQIKLNIDERKIKLLKSAGNNLSEDILEELKVMEKEEMIYTKLTDIFPGYFGQMLFINYKPFLQIKLDEDKAEAFNKFIEYIDGLPELKFNEEEINYIDELTEGFSIEDFENVNVNKNKVMDNYEEWLKENDELIKTYQKYIDSEEYKNSLMYTIKEKLSEYMIKNKYYDIAIPLIREFSPLYDEYYKKLLAADKFMKEKEVYVKKG